MTDPRAEVLRGLVVDLGDEVDALAAVVDVLPASELLLSTPAAGWTVADQLGHLAAFDERGTRAVEQPEDFRAEVAALRADGPADPVEAAVADARQMAPTEVRDWWHRAAHTMQRAAASLDPAQRLPWYGPDMGAASFVTARLMETWAHGQDVRDALGLPPSVSARLRHVIDLGVRARPYSYVVRGREVPDGPVRVLADVPPAAGGGVWTWGPEDAAAEVRGPAVDLALVLTQRRHLLDVDLEVTGSLAEDWLGIAQAFAGPPGPGRPPSRRPS